MDDTCKYVAVQLWLIAAACYSTPNINRQISIVSLQCYVQVQTSNACRPELIVLFTCVCATIAHACTTSYVHNEHILEPECNNVAQFVIGTIELCEYVQTRTHCGTHERVHTLTTRSYAKVCTSTRRACRAAAECVCVKGASSHTCLRAPVPRNNTSMRT